MVGKDEPHGNVGRRAFFLHELIAAARSEGRRADLVMLLELADDLHADFHSVAQGFTRTTLDYLKAIVLLVRATEDLFYLKDDDDLDAADELADDDQYAGKRLECSIQLLKDANQLLKISIHSLSRMKYSERDYVDFFLVRALGNRLVVGAEIDERTKSGDYELLREIALEHKELGAFDLLYSSALETDNALRAWNASEQAGLTKDEGDAEKGLRLLFLLCPPVEGEVRVTAKSAPLAIPKYLEATVSRVLAIHKATKKESLK
jgi:hypothetical protein